MNYFIVEWDAIWFLLVDWLFYVTVAIPTRYKTKSISNTQPNWSILLWYFRDTSKLVSPGKLPSHLTHNPHEGSKLTATWTRQFNAEILPVAHTEQGLLKCVRVQVKNQREIFLFSLLHRRTTSTNRNQTFGHFIIILYCYLQEIVITCHILSLWNTDSC